jgi:hypothetical protein
LKPLHQIAVQLDAPLPDVLPGAQLEQVADAVAASMMDDRPAAHPTQLDAPAALW